VEITAIQITETEAGTQLVIETASGEVLTPTSSTVGNALIVDLPNAVLALDDEAGYEAFSPAEGIAYISATALDERTVRIAITGTDAAPLGEVSRPG
jgi:iron complex outermembrane recepter protein